MRKTLQLGGPVERVSRKHGNIAYSTHMHRFLGRQTSLLINFVVQKILFASEMLRVH